MNGVQTSFGIRGGALLKIQIRLSVLTRLQAQEEGAVQEQILTSALGSCHR